MEIVSLNSITTEIAASFDRQFDEPFKRLLASKVDAWRSRLIRNSLQTRSIEAKFFRQRIYVPLQPGTLLPECISADVCNQAISVKIIPAPVRYGSSLFNFVGSVDGKIPFTDIAAGSINYMKAGRYSGDSIFYEYVNGRFAIHDHENMPAVMVDAIFDSPFEVMEFNCTNSGVDCDFWDKPYPVTGDIKQMIVQGILEKDFGNHAPANENHEVEVNP